MEAAVSNGEPAAIPVIDGLQAAVLQLAQNKVVSRVGGKVEAGSALLADGEKWLQLLALDGGGGASVLIHGIQHGVAQTNCGSAPTVTGKQVV